MKSVVTALLVLLAAAAYTQDLAIRKPPSMYRRRHAR